MTNLIYEECEYQLLFHVMKIHPSNHLLCTNKINNINNININYLSVGVTDLEANISNNKS